MRRRLLALLVAALSLLPSVKAEGGVIYYNTFVPEEYVKMADEIAARYHLSPELLIATMEHEGHGDPNSGNDYGCYGLCGVSKKWNADRMKELGVSNLYDPYGNILVAADLYYDLFLEKEDFYEVLYFYGGYQKDDPKGAEFAKWMERRVYNLEVIRGKHPEVNVKG